MVVGAVNRNIPSCTLSGLQSVSISLTLSPNPVEKTIETTSTATVTFTATVSGFPPSCDGKNIIFQKDLFEIGKCTISNGGCSNTITVSGLDKQISALGISAYIDFNNDGSLSTDERVARELLNIN